MFKEKVVYEPGDLEFYKKMWSIDPDAAKTWIDNRLNALMAISENIKQEMKQLREMTNYKDDKKARDYYNATGAGADGFGYSRTHKNKEIVIEYLRENLDVAVKTKQIINKFLSSGIKDVNFYQLFANMVEEGSIVRAGHGYLRLAESRVSVDV